MADKQRDSFHSRDFGYPGSTINGKTIEEHEKEFGVAGEISHLKKLGWENYQWRHVKESDCKEDVAIGQMRLSGKCFAEFFSIYYNGYLRGDGNTVQEAVLQCLNQAQKFAACLEHEYQSAKGYTNGLIRCKHCGFWGHTTLVQALKDKVSHLTIQLEVEKQCNLDNERNLREKGRTSQELFIESLERLGEALKEKDNDKV